MRKRLFVFAALTAFAAAVATSQEKTPPMQAFTRWQPPEPIRKALDKAKVSGSMELSGCTENMRPQYPKTRALSAGNGTAVEMLREVLADNPNISIEQATSGVVRIVDTNASIDILNLKIEHITFEDYARNFAYSPNGALTTILQAPEVSSFMNAHNLKPFSGPAGAGPPGWGQLNGPHLSGSLDNVTLIDALDKVLKVFPGLWVYWSCPQSDNKIVVRFHFFRRDAFGEIRGD